MSTKNVVTLLLTSFVAVSILVLSIKSLRPPATADSAATTTGGDTNSHQESSAKPATLENGLVAYYFHGNERCDTCRTIEAYSHDAVQSGFAERIEDGSMQWRILNYEDTANETIVEEFQVLAPIVVLARYDGGERTKWTSLDDVWSLTDDKEAFTDYVQREIRMLQK